jgi:hypothetical protein
MIEAVESIQLALFLRGPSSSDALSLWGEVFGATPAGFNTLAPGHTQAQGEISGAQLTLMVQPARVDFLLQGTGVPGQSVPPAIADASTVLERGLKAVKKVLPTLKVGRTAAVMQGYSLAQDRVDAVGKLKALIPNIPLPGNTEDASYQVVVPRKSGIASRQLKQVCRWQTLAVNLVEVLVGGFNAPQVVKQRYALHMYVDVFGDGMESLDEAQASEALEEVAAIAATIFRGGYNELH